MRANHLSNPLWWVILPLLAAVILPTVCLLWFMTQAVKNERLAVQQKLIDFYTDRAHFLIEAQDNYYRRRFEKQDSEIQNPYLFFDSFAVDPAVNTYQGLLVYDSTDNLIYPPFDSLNTAEAGIEPLPNLHLESTERIYQLCYPDNPQEIPPGRAADIMRYRVFLARRYQETNDPALIFHLRKILIYRKSNSDKQDWFLIGPVETTVWQLEKMIEIAQESGLESRLAPEIQSARNRIAAYKNTIEIAPLYPSASGLQGWTNQTIRRLSPQSDYYGCKFNVADKTVLGILTLDRLLPPSAPSIMNMQDDTVEVLISDNYGNVIAGDKTIADKPFLTLKAGKYLPDFTVSLSFKDDSVFEKAARQQTTIYIWTGILVALLVLSAGGISIRAVNQQIRMNRLKNDFIATVTHELKTPLSSMRLLVDTLLEKRYTDEKTATEYLKLVANENKRLTHLIDSFLTFSRMERNKQVFDLQPTAPAEIAQAAGEAVLAKFAAGRCDFIVHLDSPLPNVSADKEAMVTVLVNLLDNACKYTKDDKQIGLKLYAENGFVCFAVKDNGIGIPRRAQKKIFGRFYQVDNRLSRSVEGCGLGLSIVKFIVDAHHGRIEVDSTPGKGSVFTVKLPLLQKK